jgi:hypothetical protein
VHFALQPVLVLQFNGAHAMEMSLKAVGGPNTNFRLECKHAPSLPQPAIITETNEVHRMSF